MWTDFFKSILSLFVSQPPTYPAHSIMDYNSLKSLSPVVAAGVASRAALSLHLSRKTTTATEIEQEQTLRAAIIAEIREVFHLGEATDITTLETIVGHLYDYSDSLLNRIEETIAGLFTTDTAVNDNQTLKRRIRRENKIITKTIAYPTKIFQEYLSQRSGVIQYEAVYVREVDGEYPFYEFVIARKSGRVVHVNQVLRFYPNINGRISLPESQINLLLKTLGDTLSADALAEVLQAQFPIATIIIIFSSHWVFSYYTGGDTIPPRKLDVIFGDGFLDGFIPTPPVVSAVVTN